MELGSLGQQQGCEQTQEGAPTSWKQGGEEQAESEQPGCEGVCACSVPSVVPDSL